MKYLQKLGKALMLPVAALPICGILMGIGYAIAPAVMGAEGPTEGFLYVLGFFLVKAGAALIDNIAVLFAIGGCHSYPSPRRYRPAPLPSCSPEGRSCKE